MSRFTVTKGTPAFKPVTFSLTFNDEVSVQEFRAWAQQVMHQGPSGIGLAIVREIATGLREGQL